MTTEVTTARFWVFCAEGFAKLSLRDGESLRRYVGGSDEEGCSFTETIWEREGINVFRKIYSWGRDCDGPHSSEYTHVCTVYNLAAVTDYDVPVPAWEEVESSLRDYFAEAAGY
jgi:hypothetical protein